MIVFQNAAGAVFINTAVQVVESDLCRLLIERPDVTAVLDVPGRNRLKKDTFYTLPNASDYCRQHRQ